MRPTLLHPDPHAPFPPAERALREPDGLLAIGGDLSPTRLLNAYRHGIFPWYGPGQPILWWSPDPRMVFDTATFRLPSRFRRSLRGLDWEVRFDTCFEAVIDACATIPRGGEAGTWITAEMRQAYLTLHRLGHAHSVEVFSGDDLVGGLYGVGIGRMFFGESMFSAASGGSKIALAALARRLALAGCPLLDAQVANPHLQRLGGTPMPRARFLERVSGLCAAACPIGDWADPAARITAATLAAGSSTASPIA